MLADIREYIADKQKTLDRLLSKAFELNKISEDDYKRLSAEVCDSESWDEVFDHFERMYDQFREAMYDHLLRRIQKGAEYLENTSLSEKERERGMKLYDQLCAEAARFRELDQRRRWA